MRGRRTWAAALAALVYAYALLAWSRVGPAPERVHIVLDQPLEVEQAQEHYRQEDEDGLGLCFWGRAGEAGISCPATGKSAQVERQVLAGNPVLLEANALAWRDGCLLDSQTAWTLFGTERCGGQTLVWQGQTPTVLGTVQADRPTMVMAAKNADGAVLDRCVLALEGARAAELGGAFLTRRGLTGTVLEFYPLWALGADLLLLPPGVLALALGRRSWRRGRGAFSRRDRAGLCRAAVGLLLAAAGVLALVTQVAIPPELIPSRWSDFSFWSRWWADQKQALLNIALLAPGGGQLQFLVDVLQSGIASIAATVLTVGGVAERVQLTVESGQLRR